MQVQGLPSARSRSPSLHRGKGFVTSPRALESFRTALTDKNPYNSDHAARGTLIHQARQVEAHLALGNIDAALDLGHQVIDTIGGVDSARTASALEELRGRTAGHRHTPAAADFLAYAA
ncbi:MULTISPECIES: hypothetical protein [unclassified Streptomyces]|uniref:hypothetical protein n=1 Tax=unclassified Streptomyces TaxID=2593676 RepID=UPI00225A9B0B|nr:MULTISPECIES: hypothetical protein [unclassified Streptomyces]MCX4792757.1 hypothetical protein [Streptomyces sp. NBC_01242]WSP59727.1 hypothetical protein OG306_39430 [Streptomyces sp. NBC_01241]WSP60682.1 hypothetical protein OG466_01020 [Streptomyces sp. NBC_01240]WSU19757.1 hypothetical protein OG508_00935 [Streptomyces sp. NBC_01108]